MDRKNSLSLYYYLKTYKFLSAFCLVIFKKKRLKGENASLKSFAECTFFLWSQAPSDRQLRYKEKVTELRKKRNSSLNKEQKEKHIVSGWDLLRLSVPYSRTSPYKDLASLPLPLRWQDHRQSHGASREPLLENITSDYDLELFRKAQARASEDLVREKAHHHFPPLSFLFSSFCWITLLPLCSIQQTLPSSLRSRNSLCDTP